jgi:hypothetical protein
VPQHMPVYIGLSPVISQHHTAADHCCCCCCCCYHRRLRATHGMQTTSWPCMRAGAAVTWTTCAPCVSPATLQSLRSKQQHEQRSGSGGSWAPQTYAPGLGVPQAAKQQQQQGVGLGVWRNPSRQRQG